MIDPRFFSHLGPYSVGDIAKRIGAEVAEDGSERLMINDVAGIVKRQALSDRPDASQIDRANNRPDSGAALRQLQHGISQQLYFNPASSERSFSISIWDFLMGCLLSVHACGSWAKL